MNRSVETLNEEFPRLEMRGGWFQKKINGIKIWERIRHQVIRDLRRSTEEMQDLETDSFTAKGKLRKLMLLSRNLVWRNPYLSEQSEILFVSRGRRKSYKGRKWDRLCDPILDSLESDHLMLESADMDSLCHHEPAKTSRLRYMDLPRYSAGILRSLGAVKINLDSEDLQWIIDIEETLEEEFGERPDVKERVEFQLKQRKVMKPQYKFVLNKIRPEIVVMVNHNDFPLNEAASELGVGTAEIQHGIISKNHFAYSFPKEVDTQSFPDFLLTWGDFWTNGINLPFKKTQIHAVGNPYLEMRKEELEVRKSQNVVVVSQWSISDLLERFAIQIQRKTDYQVIYKLHPREVSEWKDEYPKLLESEVEVETGKEKDIYEVFSECFAQVGVYSTALFEGVYFGLETYLINHPSISMVEDRIELDVMQKVESVHDITEKLGSGNQEDTTIIFESNFQHNFEEFLYEAKK
jgi:hypothetical protein